MKNLTPKTNLLIANILMGIGAVIAAFDIVVYDLLTGENQNQPVLISLAIIFVAAGIAWRFCLVRCPHCGDHLIGHKRLPLNCPACGKPLDTNSTEEGSHEEADR